MQVWYSPSRYCPQDELRRYLSAKWTERQSWLLHIPALLDAPLLVDTGDPMRQQAVGLRALRYGFLVMMSVGQQMCHTVTYYSAYRICGVLTVRKVV